MPQGMMRSYSSSCRTRSAPRQLLEIPCTRWALIASPVQMTGGGCASSGYMFYRRCMTRTEAVY